MYKWVKCYGKKNQQFRAFSDGGAVELQQLPEGDAAFRGEFRGLPRQDMIKFARLYLPPSF